MSALGASRGGGTRPRASARAQELVTDRSLLWIDLPPGAAVQVVGTFGPVLAEAPPDYLRVEPLLPANRSAAARSASMLDRSKELRRRRERVHTHTEDRLSDHIPIVRPKRR